jgi:uncharacterized protein YegL
MEVPLDDNFVCISALIDNSGSMANLNTTELAQGLTKLVKDQCEMNKEVIFYGATFSDEFNIFKDGVEGNTINIKKEDILPDGMTALIPAFARMIKYTDTKLSNMTTKRPGQVIFILLSDGEQTVNHFSPKSRLPEDKEYEGNEAKSNLKKLIEEHNNIKTEGSKWDFLYLGTNYDSIKAGSDLGIAPQQCLNYNYTPQGSQQALRACSQAVSRIKNKNFTGFLEEERNMAQDK